MADVKTEGSCIPCQKVDSKDWYAWINLMPPPPDDFHVVGEVLVPNPGVDPLLVPKNPQGINPEILLMDLLLIQRPGIWPQHLVWKQARYDKIGRGFKYREVDVFCGQENIARIKVEEVN